VDAITRAAQPALAKALGANVVVDNQPGAGGVVGLQALAQVAAPTAARCRWCRTTW
jgi:tripartite-type tricarboxylate transporter receptor subunit TctC